MKKSKTNIIQNCVVCNTLITVGTGTLYKGKFPLCQYCASQSKKELKHSVSFFLKINSNFRKMFKMFGFPVKESDWTEQRYKKLNEFKKAIYEK